ncbi:MAG: hypothetical protein AAFY17_17290, partial [Cyanobacteria bacterium J06642_11]
VQLSQSHSLRPLVLPAPTYLHRPLINDAIWIVSLDSTLVMWTESWAAQGVAGNEIDSIELLEHQMLNLLSWNYPFQYVSLPTRLILLIKHFVRHIYTLNEFDTALTSMPIPSR